MLNDLSSLRNVALSDKYDLSVDQVYLTGTQALVRLCLIQSERDRAAGLSTAGYVTGYPGFLVANTRSTMYRSIFSSM